MMPNECFNQDKKLFRSSKYFNKDAILRSSIKKKRNSQFTVVMNVIIFSLLLQDDQSD